MTDEADPDMVAVLARRMAATTNPLADRRARELKSVHHLDRRGIRTPPEHVRNIQLNLKISPREKQRLSAFATAHNMSITTLLITAFNAYAERERKP